MMKMNSEKETKVLPKDLIVGKILFNENNELVDDGELLDVLKAVVEMLNIVDEKSLNILKSLNGLNEADKCIYHLETIYYLLREFCNYDMEKKNNNEKSYFITLDNFLESHRNYYVDLGSLYDAIGL